MGDEAKQEQAYRFLRDRARSGEPFTKKDLGDYCGWKGQTPGSYVSKQYRAYLQGYRGFGGKKGQYKVLPEFNRVTWDEFRELVTQVRHPFASYRRANFQSFVVYEFLMPLTREDKLRRALANEKLVHGAARSSVAVDRSSRWNHFNREIAVE